MPATPETASRITDESTTRIEWRPAPQTYMCPTDASRTPVRAQLRPEVRSISLAPKHSPSAAANCTALATVSASLAGVSALFALTASKGPLAVTLAVSYAATQLAKLITTASLMVKGDTFADATIKSSEMLELLDVVGQLETLIVKGLGRETKLLHDLQEAKAQITTGKEQDVFEGLNKVAEIFCEFWSEVNDRKQSHDSSSPTSKVQDD